MRNLFMMLTAFIGLLIPLQALINARLASIVGGPIQAATISFVVGTLVLVVLITVFKLPVPALGGMAAMPWWIWAGGLLGAYFVAVSALTVPVLGAGTLVAIIVGGQLLSSLLLDHYGILHAAQPLTGQRILGAGLLIAGVFLITRPDVAT